MPRSAFRADAAAYRSAPDPGAIGETALFECKQSRADFLKDAQPWHAAAELLASLQQRRRRMESLLAIHRPHLRRGETLFPEFDALDGGEADHASYRRLLREIRRCQAAAGEKSKFERMAFYRYANALYLVAPDDIVDESEIPPGWGWLVGDGSGELRVARRPARHETPPAQRLALLEKIAAAAARDSLL
ncbi:MAG: hypothetical protein R3F11_02485 [Verrucomicrobiales bacterium]